MKSILVDFIRSQTAVLTILKTLNFNFWKKLTLEKAKVPKNSKFRPAQIHIKITQCQDLETIFLQNHTTDFDETLHVVWICPGKGFGTIGTFGYSLV